MLLIALVAASAALGCVWKAAAEPAESREGRIKAAALYYLAKYTEWPPSAFAEPAAPFRFCMQGRDPANSSIAATIKDKTISGRPAAAIDVEPRGCQVLHLGALDAAAAARLAALQRGRPVLVVTGARDLFDRGDAAVLLSKQENKMNITVNQAAVSAAGFKMLPELLDIVNVKK